MLLVRLGIFYIYIVLTFVLFALCLCCCFVEIGLSFGGAPLVVVGGI